MWLWQHKLGEKLYPSLDDGSNFTLLIYKVQQFNFSASPKLISFLSPEFAEADSYATITLTSKDKGQSKNSDKLYYTAKVTRCLQFCSQLSSLCSTPIECFLCSAHKPIGTERARNVPLAQR
jgi:hypothetical protein